MKPCYYGGSNELNGVVSRLYPIIQENRRKESDSMNHYYLKKMNELITLTQTHNSEGKYLLALNKAVEQNETKLEHTRIKIPFTHRYLFDDIGLVNKRVPTLLAENKKLVTEYNQQLAHYRKRDQELKRSWINLGNKMALSADDNTRCYGNQILKLYN